MLSVGKKRLTHFYHKDLRGITFLITFAKSIPIQIDINIATIMDMKKTLLFIAIAALTACGGQKTQKDCCAIDSVYTNEEVVSESPHSTDINKHTEAYILERMDSIYSRYKDKNVTIGEYGREIRRDINYDSLFCSSRYNKLFDEAGEICMKNDDILLDYDHWTRSQDDGDFRVKSIKVENMTDSTAIAIVEATNFEHKTIIKLSLFFERNDWYVDDFLNEGGPDGEKAFFREYIKNGGQ